MSEWLGAPRWQRAGRAEYDSILPSLPNQTTPGQENSVGRNLRRTVVLVLDIMN
jgi:hypothetical protein